jgi:hypothetical protein
VPGLETEHGVVPLLIPRRLTDLIENQRLSGHTNKK